MYNIRIIASAGKDLNRLDKKLFLRIKDKILALSFDPRPHNCVKLTSDEGYRIRSGNYRILYRIDDRGKIVFIYRIKHRRESYR